MMTVRVLHAIESLKPEAGSVAISLRGLLHTLDKHDVRSMVVTGDDSTGSEGNPADHLENIEVKRGHAATLREDIQAVDAVHLHGGHSEFARAMVSAARRAGRPYVVSPLGEGSGGATVGSGWTAWLRGLIGGEDKLLRHAAVIAVSNETQRRDLGRPSLDGRVQVLPYGLCWEEYALPGDASAETSAGLPQAPAGRCLLLLGPIHPEEGLVPFLKAFAEIGPAGDGWSVVIAGPERGNWRIMLEAAIRRKGGGQRVLFTPAPHEAVQRGWLARAAVVVVPSLHVRCPVSILQALAAGVVVIASDRVAPDGLEEMTPTCPPERQAWKKVLRSVLQQTDAQRQTAGRSARQAGRARWDWSVLATSYAQLYRSLS